MEVFFFPTFTTIDKGSELYHELGPLLMPQGRWVTDF